MSRLEREDWWRANRPSYEPLPKFMPDPNAERPIQVTVRDDIEMFRERMMLLPECIERTRLVVLLEKVETLAVIAAGKVK